ncbi:MAG: hypothetical protein R6X02_12620 [Enhygromyxa sp.]
MSSTPGPAAPSLSLRRSSAALARDDGRLGWAPLLAALAIDLADLVGAGPHGLVIGAVLTTIVALASGVRLRRSLGLGVLGAIYLALPLTEPLPLATMLTLLHGSLLRMRSRKLEPEPDQSRA